MKMPDSIKIGAHSFDVKIVPNLKDDSAHNCCGRCNGSEQKIEINPCYPQSCQEATLIHEIIEGINYLYELGLEHHQITILEETLYQVLKENRLHFDDGEEGD